LKHPFKLLVVDIDGTLVNKTGIISPKDDKALVKVRTNVPYPCVLDGAPTCNTPYTQEILLGHRSLNRATAVDEEWNPSKGNQTARFLDWGKPQIGRSYVT
jgi:hypothetical protein